MRRCCRMLSRVFILAALTACGSGGGTVATVDSAPGAGIFGRLLDEEGNPVPDAQIEVLDAQEVRIGQPVVTGADGSFRIDLPGGEVPEELTLRVHPPHRPQSQAVVEVPPGSLVEVQVQLRPEGGAALQALLQPPGSARQLMPLGARPVHGLLCPAGRTEPFRLAIRGQFDPARADVRLVYRLAGGGQWWIASAAGRQSGGEFELVLEVGSAATELHGRVIEVRALAAPNQSLDGVTTFTAPRDLGVRVALSPEPVMTVLVATRERRVTAGTILPNAILALGGTANTIGVTADDLAVLGLVDGQRVSLGRDGASARVDVVESRDAVLELATVRLDEATAATLGLEPRRRLAGYTLTVRPLD